MGGPPPEAEVLGTPAELGTVCKIGGLTQLNKLINETPAIILDFWSPTCPPCMRIKPIFENAAKVNENENLIFAACDTSKVHDAPQHFQVTGIPNFIAFLNGKVYRNFKGANE